MSRIVIGRKAWVVVCDGGKALFLRNDGDADLVNLTVADHMGQHVEATRDLGVDQPGRAFRQRERTAAPWGKPTGTIRPRRTS